MKLDQQAFYARDNFAAKEIKKYFGLEEAEWVQDQVEGKVICPLQGMQGLSKGLLQFNYSLGIELEILTYIDGPHWHLDNDDYHSRYSFHSHQGIHLEDDESFPTQNNFQLVQEMMTFSHTNPYIVSKNRTYHYKIYNTKELLGVYTKYIKRIQP